jgi:hypothetical protein
MIEGYDAASLQELSSFIGIKWEDFVEEEKEVTDAILECGYGGFISEKL